MEMVTKVMRTEIRFAEIAVRDMAKIAAKKPDEPVKIQQNQFFKDDLNIGRYITQMGKAIGQAEEVQRQDPTFG